MKDRRVWLYVSVLALAVAVVAVMSVPHVPTHLPAPDAPSYVELADNLASGDGYRVDMEGEPRGSRYPPGFPILLALLSPVTDATGASLLLAGALMVAVWFAARNAGGPIASTVAVLILAFYLPQHRFAGAVMADLTGALFVVLGLVALQRGRPRLAGLLAGFSVWVRLAHVAIVCALPRRAVLPFVSMCAGLGVTKLAWGWGYGDGQAEWALSNIWSLDGVAGQMFGGVSAPEQLSNGLPNVVAYPLLILGLYGNVLPPGAAVLAAVAVWRRRTQRRYVAGVTVGLLAVYLPYYFQDDRFLFPIVSLVAVYAGAWCSDRVAHVELAEAGAGTWHPRVTARLGSELQG